MNQDSEVFLEAVNAEVRRGFIRKVFGILTLLLAFTGGGVALIYQAIEKDTKWAQQWKSS